MNRLGPLTVRNVERTVADNFQPVGAEPLRQSIFFAPTLFDWARWLFVRSFRTLLLIFRASANNPEQNKKQFLHLIVFRGKMSHPPLTAGSIAYIFNNNEVANSPFARPVLQIINIKKIVSAGPNPTPDRYR